jgi:hypothetical protein
MQHLSVKLENVITCLKLIILTKETTHLYCQHFINYYFYFGSGLFDTQVPNLK